MAHVTNFLGLLEQLQSADITVHQGRCAVVRNRNATCMKCAEVCTSGCISYDDNELTIEPERCIGCGTCVNSCPYEVPQIDEEAGVSSKCTLCFDRLDNDHRPWCVQACPAEARIVGDLNDPESEVSKYIAEKGAVPYLEENGTTPSVYYV